MHKTTICVLLSAFAFPGAGHFYLRHLKLGSLLLLSFCIPFYVVSTFTYQQLKIVYFALWEFKVEPTFSAMIYYMFNEVEDIDDKIRATKAAYFALFIWCIGILDSYRQARSQNKTYNQQP